MFIFSCYQDDTSHHPQSEPASALQCLAIAKKRQDVTDYIMPKFHLLGLMGFCLFGCHFQDSAFPDVVAAHSAIQTPCFWIFPRHKIDSGDASVCWGQAFYFAVE